MGKSLGRQLMVLKDQYAELARALGSPSNGLEAVIARANQLQERVKALTAEIERLQTQIASTDGIAALVLRFRSARS